MSKTITVSDETADLLDHYVEEGRYANIGEAADHMILLAAQDGWDPDIVASVAEANQQIDEGLGIPFSRELVHQIFENARERTVKNLS
jgi:hypothetical protein